MRFFFYGTLCDPDIRRLIIGHDLPRDQIEAAELRGYMVRRAHAGAFPILLRMAGRAAAGLIAGGLSAGDAARLDAYEGHGYRRRRLPVLRADGTMDEAEVYLPNNRLRGTPRAWDLQTWQPYEKQAFLRALGRPARARRST